MSGWGRGWMSGWMDLTFASLILIALVLLANPAGGGAVALRSLRREALRHELRWRECD